MIVTRTECDMCHTTTHCFTLGDPEVAILVMCLKCYPYALDIMTERNQFPLCTVCLGCTSWNAADMFEPAVCERCKSGLNKKGLVMNQDKIIIHTDCSPSGTEFYFAELFVEGIDDPKSNVSPTGGTLEELLDHICDFIYNTGQFRLFSASILMEDGKEVEWEFTCLRCNDTCTVRGHDALAARRRGVCRDCYILGLSASR